MIRLFPILLLAAAMTAMIVTPSTAQKKEPAKKESTKKEATPPPQTSGGIKEVLSQYVGKTTNLGTLKKVTADYFILEEDGATIMHPLSALHTIKVSKDEESGETVVELRLISRD